jgi:hypothetical protein
LDIFQPGAPHGQTHQLQPSQDRWRLLIIAKVAMPEHVRAKDRRLHAAQELPDFRLASLKSYLVIGKLRPLSEH